MFRNLISAVALMVIVTGCATPREPLNSAQQKFRNQEVRLLFARLIASPPGVGADILFFGPQKYSNARVSVPVAADGNTKSFWIVCAKTYISPGGFLGAREIDVSAEVIETARGIRLSMSRRGWDILGSRCDGPFGPFPELEALSGKA